MENHNVTLEGRIDDNSVSLTLVGDNGKIEDTERYTFEQLQEMSGEMFELSATVEHEPETLELPKEGDIAYDTDAPHWSDNNEVEVITVTNSPANDYTIYGSKEPYTTVARQNPEYPEDDRVIVCRYKNGNNDYAFPVSRLKY